MVLHAEPDEPTSSAAKPGRSSSLELLRVLAALMIVARHLVGENALALPALNPSALSLRSCIGAVFPLLSDFWWYTASYAAFLLPFLQLALRSLGERAHRRLRTVVACAWGVASGLLLGIGLDTSS